MKLSNKIIICFLTGLMLMTSLAIVSYFLIGDINNRYINNNEFNSRHQLLYQTLSRYHQELEQILNNKTLTEAYVPLSNQYSQWLTEYVEFEKDIYFDGYVALSQQSAILLKNSLDKIKTLNQADSLLAAHLVDLQEKNKLFFNQLRKDYQDGRIILQQRQNELNERSTQYQMLLIAICIFAVVFGLIAAILITKTLLLPLYFIEYTARSIGNGDLKARVPIKSKDELGRISETLNKMAEDLANTTISKDYFNSILHAMADTLIVVNHEGVIESFNPATIKELGYQELELKGRKLDTIMHNYTWPKEAALDELIAHGLVDNNVIRNYITRDGKIIPMLYSGSVILNNQQQFMGIVCIAHNISEYRKVQQELAEKHHHLELIINTIHEGIIVTDEHQKITSLNERAARILAKSIETLIGRSIEETLCFVDPKSKVNKPLSSFEHENKHDGQYYADLCYKNSHGQFIYVEVTIHVMDKETATGASIYVIRDISIHKEARQQLLLAKDAAEKANQTKSDFLAIMSHEIRTPLIGVIGVTELLEETTLDAEQQSLVATAYRSGNHLLMLINDILDFSKIEAGKLDLEQIDFDLLELMHDIRILYREQMKQKNITFTMKIDPQAHIISRGDPGRIRQVLINLVGNALKFTPSGKIKVNCLVQEKQGRHLQVRIAVKDSGIGISPEGRAKLFHSFTQAENSITRKYGGTGLGLAICKRLIEMMNGSIGVDSELGHGSTFWFELPMEIIDQSNFDPAQNATIHQVEELALNGQRVKVLLAEDNPVNQEIGQKILQKLNCDCVLAENGRVCLEQYQEQRFDIVLMDCQMPEMNGFDASVAIRDYEEKERLARTPIIALTADASENARDECLSHQMDDYLTKPYTRSQLKEIIAKWLLSSHHHLHLDVAAGIDFSFLNAESYNNLQAIAKETNQSIDRFITVFIEQSQAHLQLLQHALNDDNLSQLKTTAFAIELGAEQLGALEMAQFAHEIIALCDQYNHQTCTQLLSELEQSFTRTLSALDYKAAS